MKTPFWIPACLTLFFGCETGAQVNDAPERQQPLLDSIVWDYGDPEVEESAQQICSCFAEAMRAGGDKKMVDELIKDMDSMVGLNRDEQRSLEATLELKYQKMGFSPNDLNVGNLPDCKAQLERDFGHLANTLPGKRKLFLIKKTLELKCVLTRAMFASGG
jgi:hypothetical protein